MGYKSKKEGVYVYIRGFPGGSDNKISACNMGDPGLILGSGRSPGEENGYTPVFLAGESWEKEPRGLQSMGS